MSADRAVRLRVFRIAVLLSTILSLLCLVVPNEAVLPGVGRYLGTGKAAAADVIATTVDNSTSDAAVMSPTQRKLFYAAGRFWVFYSNGADLVYKSSPDGSSWSAESASLGAITSGAGLSAHFDGTYVHYARSTGTNDDPLYYRRGIPGADGAIAWSADEQEAVPGVSGVRYLHPSVSADSSGHALVSYHYEKQSGLAGEGPCITKSGNTDGTWGTAPAGFPHELTTASESEWYTTVHGLSADKIAVTFADHTDGVGVSVATYDGANWNSARTTVSDPQFGSSYSAVAEGDDVHIALLTTAAYDLMYCKYTYATNTLGTEHTLLNTTTSSSFPALARDSNNDLYCFWPGAPAAGHIYYSRMISGVWDAGYTDWLTETDLTANGGVSAFYAQGASGYIGVAWETGAASPYEVRFAAVDTAVAPNQPPNQPDNTSPADGAAGVSLTPTLQSSDFSDPDTGDTHGASQWQVTSISGNYSSPVFDSQTDNVNLLSIPVPADKLSYSTTYYWHVRHRDNHGEWADWSAETSFSTVSAPNQIPNQPVNVLPANGATGISLTPTLQSSDFSDADSGDNHGASQWQMTSISGNYSSPVFDSQTDNVNLLSILVPSGRLSYSVAYYWHVRHQDNHGDWSAWSAETAFSTVSAPNQVPNQPANMLPANRATDVSLTPVLGSSGFSDPDSGDIHGASQWQITHTSGDYSSPVFDSQADAANLLSILVPTGRLSYSVTYYWHVRHQDNHGDWSAWSAETSFSTVSAPNRVPNQPANMLPANGATDVSLTPVLGSSGFSDPDTGDTHGASQWQITAVPGDYSNPVFDSQADTVNLLGILVPSGRLSYSTTYFWRVRHQDNHGEWSEWSPEIPFTTAPEVNQGPSRPDNASPVDAASDQSLAPTLQSSDFSDPDIGDTHVASQWQITVVPGDYSNPVFDSQMDAANLLSIVVPADRLNYSTTYYWHVRHQDSRGDWSDWSPETSFATAAAPATLPDEPGGDDAAPVSPDANDGRGLLPFFLAIAAGVAAVAIVGSMLFLAYGAHVRLVNKPRGLRSARTISRRLRK